MTFMTSTLTVSHIKHFLEFVLSVSPMRIRHWTNQIVYIFATAVKSNHVFTHENVCNLRVTAIQILFMLLHIFEHANLYMGSNKSCASLLQYICFIIIFKRS